MVQHFKIDLEVQYNNILQNNQYMSTIFVDFI